MAQAEFKAKLGNRGSIKGEKTFSDAPPVRKAKFHTEWQGKTKGDTTHKKQRSI